MRDYETICRILLALLFAVSGCTGITESQLPTPEKEEQPGTEPSEPKSDEPEEPEEEAAPADEQLPPAGSADRLYLPETAAKEIRFPDDEAV